MSDHQPLNSKVPYLLKVSFIVHFFADIIFAVPLFLFPIEILHFLGWNSIDPFTTRLVAAALFGIGIESLLGRNGSLEQFKGMLNLKIIWSLMAVAGILWSILENSNGLPLFAFIFLGIFAIFHALWVYWKIIILKEIKKLRNQ